MIGRLLAALGLGPATEIHGVDDLKKGPVQARGTLVCSPLPSPIEHKPCAGYLYLASHLGWRTVGPSSRKTIHKTEVYASPMSLTLEDGGEVELVASRSGEWSPEAHARLAERDLPGFRARETLLPVNARVCVLGTARMREGRWQILIDQIQRSA